MNALHPVFPQYFVAGLAIALLLRYRRSLAESAERSKTLALLCAWPNRTRTASVLATAAIAGLLLLPGSMAAEIGHTASVKLRNWEMRAPSETCLAKKYTVTVAGTTYYLPAAPVITIRAGKISYHFQSNKALRDICEKTPNAHHPLHAENLNFDFTIPLRGHFCQAAQSSWSRNLCNPGHNSSDESYPAIANIYSPDEYDSKRLMSGATHAAFIDSRDKAIAAKHPFEPEQVGNLDRYADGYWVARSGTWINDAGEPFTLHCQPSSQVGILSCSASYRLKIGPQVNYHFSARTNKLETAARKIDKNLHQLLDELSEP